MLSGLLLLAIILFIGIYKKYRKNITLYKNAGKLGDNTTLKEAPGPTPLPLIGSLHLMGKNESPFETFTELSKIYGDIYTLTLGTTKCLVVNNLNLIREVLNQNGRFFDGRPDFQRFHQLFAGDRNNSLALCDWSNLQLRRRNLARKHCGPKKHTSKFARIGDIAAFESNELMQTLKKVTSQTTDSIKIKPILMTTAMNMFTHYMCNVRFEDTDTEFKNVVDIFDDIFWELNQGYLLDFIPSLKPFYKRHLNKLSSWSQEIRSFIMTRIVEPREHIIDTDEPEQDFLDGLLSVLQNDPTVDRNTIIFMLEDFLGGHSSVGNLVMLALTAAARDPDVAKKVQAEIDGVTEDKRPASLMDRPNLPYTEATILECLRYSSSPIVPHVCTENAKIAGYGVEKGTVVLINNYKLNTSEAYWDNPTKFEPMRFLEKTKVCAGGNSSCDSGLDSDCKRQLKGETDNEVWSVKKNIPHFLPFSIGKRTCIGQTLVTTMSFVMFANIIQEYDVGCEREEDLKQKPACVALPKETYGLYLMPRKQ